MKPLELLFATFLFVTITNAQTSLRNLLEGYGTPGSDDGLGSGIIGLGDINNDGWDDFAVSAIGIHKTFLYFGGPKILDAAPDIVLKGGGRMSIGDLNGDGRKDLVIRQSVTTGNIDTLLVYFGKQPSLASPLSLDTIPGFIFYSETGVDMYGYSFAIGDLNADGFDDLVVSASWYSSYRGKIYVYLGGKTLTDVTQK
ncbi:MAG: FG-GAP and VCBS repeat-containing protein [bacterium]